MKYKLTIQPKPAQNSDSVPYKQPTACIYYQDFEHVITVIGKQIGRQSQSFTPA